jgi:tetratricopeptide (TPR) repeat protein
LRRAVTFILLLLGSVAVAQKTPPASQTLIVVPFENASKAPGLEWIGEAFPEVLGQRMGSAALYLITREDRTYAFDRTGIPIHLRPTRATLFRIAEQMDVDYMVLGQYTYDGASFTATAQALDVKRLRLLPEHKESGPLVKLIEIQTALAWDLLRDISPTFKTGRADFLAASPPIRLDALENYVRGITATTRQEKISKLREAIRRNPSYAQAILQLGKTYFAGREYESAATWLARVPRSDAAAQEANFYAGLAYYYLGNFERAEEAFSFLASRFPLTEVYNNLGVMQARRGKRTAAEFFQKAADADPGDPDYHFNLGVALYRNGEAGNAARQLREALNLRPGDAEAKSVLEAIVNGGTAASLPARLPGQRPNGSGPLERVKRNYDENSYRQLALEIQNATEARLAQTDARSHAAYHVEHGHELLAQGFRAEAAREFTEAIQLDPANAGAHAGMAGIHEANSDWAGARNEARTAIQLKPSSEAYLVLARLDLRENKAEEAAAEVDRALALEPGNADALELKRAVAARLMKKSE